MRSYKVCWEVKIAAFDPLTAAMEASSYMDDKTMQVFNVVDLATQKTTVVDSDAVMDQERISELWGKISQLIDLQNEGKPIDESYLSQLANELDSLEGNE